VIKDGLVYLSDGVVTDGQDGVITKGMLVDVGMGEESRWVDVSVKGLYRPILVDSGGYHNGTGLEDIVGKATDPFDEALITVTAADPHIEP
jgi:hypothetical protein